ncbi:HAMP domain-containing sensor histidine kinase [Kocuria turfanensis]|uniref:histidine kinase n=1 Tax=Kocuria turfanensis TaxID=388357 RepID=A0A512IHZ1_9MICC|nr:ATP-binding protein [Kocuria turfanensis]GEO97329.1 two-component sensor histidine kinase [Kocuria turfanensis]
MSPRYERGLASRFLAAQLLVVAASLAAAVVVASVAGPPIFHEHLIMAGHAENSPELLHVEQAYRDTNLITLGVALGTALVCALVVSAWCSRRLRAPLERLTEAAQGMARGRYDTRVPAMGAGAEVDALASSFNTMAARLERTEDTRRRMLSDLAHEMRTPLSVLAVYLEALQDGVTRWDEATGELMSDQLGRLTRLVEDINDVSRAEEGRIDLNRDEEKAGELIRSAVEAHREAYAAKGVSLVLDAQDHTAGTVEVDRQRMGQVLGNLLTNALRHTPPGGTVSVRATAHGPHRLALVVADTGDGIPGEHLPQVFERFYRGDTARDRDHGGSGIGLTISKALVEAHGGTLTATSPGPGQGAIFTVELPRHSSRPARTSA